MVFFLMKILALVILLVLGWEFCWWGLGVRPLMPWRLKGSLQESPEEFTLVDKRGFTEVHNLTFGMLGWLLSGGETHRKKEKSKRRTY
jgi:hypothetical protein